IGYCYLNRVQTCALLIYGYYVRDTIATDAEQRKLEARLGQHGLRQLTAPLQALDDTSPPQPPARRSVRHYRSAPVEAGQLAVMLASLRQGNEAGVPRYRYASAGGLYPVQVYVQVAAERVKGLAAGLYYYHPGANALQCVTPDS